MERYRKDHPLPPSKLSNGLLAEGAVREVEVEGMDYPTSVECFTLPEAAKALGRTELTLKKWIATDMIPAPVLRDTSRGYRHYSVGELRIMARVLAEHERDNAYYTTGSIYTKERLMQAVHAYRMQYI